MLTHDLFTPMNSTVNVSPDCFVEIDNIAIYKVSKNEEVEVNEREEFERRNAARIDDDEDWEGYRDGEDEGPESK